MFYIHYLYVQVYTYMHENSFIYLYTYAHVELFAYYQNLPDAHYNICVGGVEKWETSFKLYDQYGAQTKVAVIAGASCLPPYYRHSKTNRCFSADHIHSPSTWIHPKRGPRLVLVSELCEMYFSTKAVFKPWINIKQSACHALSSKCQNDPFRLSNNLRKLLLSHAVPLIRPNDETTWAAVTKDETRVIIVQTKSIVTARYFVMFTIVDRRERPLCEVTALAFYQK